MSPIVSTLSGASARGYGGMKTFGPPPIVGDFQSIQTVTNTSSFTGAEFTSIPATFTNLQIRMYGRNANNSNGVKIEFNSDTTTTNYYNHAMFGSGGGASGWNQNLNNFAYWSETGVTANVFGAYIVNIHDYTSTVKTKTLSSYGGFDANGSGYSWRNSLSWNSAAAITNIKLSAVGGGAFAAYSSFALYGIKG
jgi:hypothetical protein